MTTYVQIEVGDTAETFPLTFPIEFGTEDWRDFISCNVTRSVSDNNTISTMKATFDNETGAAKARFNIGDEIIVRSEKNVNNPTTNIFRGIIDDVNFKGRGQKEDLTITAVDYSAYLRDNTVQPVVYTDSEVSTIVTSIMANEVPSISVANVDVTSTTLDRISFNQTNVFDALKQLAELSDSYFYVDEEKVLNFKSKSITSSGETLDETNIRHLTTKNSRDEIVNKLWVYGDSILVNHIDTFTFDGGSVAQLTYNPHNVSVNVTGADILGGGIWEMTSTPGSEERWLVNFDDKQVIFTSGTLAGLNIPTSGNIGSITYDRSQPIIKYGERATSIGSYGPKEQVIQDKNIKDPRTAKAIVNNTLDAKSEPYKQITARLNNIVALTPGETVIVDQPHHNINSSTYEVIESRYNFNHKTMFEDSVLTVKLNKRKTDTLDIIKQILLDIKKIQAGDIGLADVYTRLQNAQDNYSFNITDWKVKTRDVSGTTLIWGHPVYGTLGEKKWSATLPGTSTTVASGTS